jgi:hypothetical protein
VICVDFTRLRQHLDYLDQERRVLHSARQALAQSCADATDLTQRHLQFIQSRLRTLDGRRQLLVSIIDTLSGAQNEIQDKLNVLHRGTAGGRK